MMSNGIVLPRHRKLMAEAALSQAPKHTPGPWRFERHIETSKWLGNIVGSYGLNELGVESIRTISCQTRYGNADEQVANALLTAAAPDLLEALKELLAHTSFLGIASHYEDMARSAIAKAEGRS